MNTLLFTLNIISNGITSWSLDLVTNVVVLTRFSWSVFSPKTWTLHKISLSSFNLDYNDIIIFDQEWSKKQFFYVLWLWKIAKITLCYEICWWVMCSCLNTFHHACVFLCLECEEVLKFSTLDKVLQLMSKMAHEVQGFHKWFHLIKTNPSYKVPCIINMHPDRSYL